MTTIEAQVLQLAKAAKQVAPVIATLPTVRKNAVLQHLSLIHISEPTRRHHVSRMPSSA